MLAYCSLEGGIIPLSQQSKEALGRVLQDVDDYIPQEIVIAAVNEEETALSSAANAVLGAFWDQRPWSGRLYKLLCVEGIWTIIGQPIAISFELATAAVT